MMIMFLNDFFGFSDLSLNQLIFVESTGLPISSVKKIYLTGWTSCFVELTG